MSMASWNYRLRFLLLRNESFRYQTLSSSLHSLHKGQSVSPIYPWILLLPQQLLPFCFSQTSPSFVQITFHRIDRQLARFIGASDLRMFLYMNFIFGNHFLFQGSKLYHFLSYKMTSFIFVIYDKQKREFLNNAAWFNCQGFLKEKIIPLYNIKYVSPPFARHP